MVTELADRSPSLASGVETLRRGYGWVDRSTWDRLEISGEDRGRFLGGMVTCEVRDLGAGHGAYGFVTTRKGGVLSDFALLEMGDRFWLELPAGRAAAVAEHLGRFVLADRVAIRELTGQALLALAGGASREALRELVGGTLPAELDTRWGHAAVTIAGVSVRLAHRPLLGVEVWSLWVAREDAPELTRALGEARISEIDYDALDTARIEAGVPWWGRDYGESNLPQETGLDEAVSFTKGCYLGQEVVARVHYRGGVNRFLRGLQFDGDEPPASGTELLFEGRAVGTVGSVTISPMLEGPIGLALVHKRGAAPGTRLEVAGGDGEAEVAELPFVE